MAFYNLFAELKDQLDGNTHFTPAEFEPEVPPEVRLFLGRLSMLQGVPPEYLVPDEKLLQKFRLVNGVQEEQGALRFFWIDPAWVECLLDGALSVGPDADRELLLTKAMAGNYLAEAFQKELIERFKKQLAGSYAPEEFKKEMAERIKAKGVQIGDDFNKIAPPTLAQDNWRFTGFLLRSSLISGWRGLEIEVQGKNFVTDPDSAVRTLQLVRMEKIAPDTLFCLCEGVITKVVIIQPPENLHFGLTGDSDVKSFSKQFTGVSGASKTPGATVTVPLRTARSDDQDKRVIRVKGSGTGLADLLSPTASSADFAMEMIAQPIRNEIKVDWQQEK